MSSSFENAVDHDLSAGGSKGFMLFGVRVMESGGGSFRKSASMINLAQFDSEQQPLNDSNTDITATGYASDDVVHPSARTRERKKGVAWTEEEHRLFLLGLQKIGKGDWRGISRNFVKTRTPTQVASHAQKYFLRRVHSNRRRRRSSLFDITTDSVVCSEKVEDGRQQNAENRSMEKGFRSPSSKMAHLNFQEPSPLSLKLSATILTSSSTEQKSPAMRISSNFHACPVDSTGTVMGIA